MSSGLLTPPVKGALVGYTLLSLTMLGKGSWSEDSDPFAVRFHRGSAEARKVPHNRRTIPPLTRALACLVKLAGRGHKAVETVAILTFPQNLQKPFPRFTSRVWPWGRAWSGSGLGREPVFLDIFSELHRTDLILTD